MRNNRLLPTDSNRLPAARTGPEYPQPVTVYEPTYRVEADSGGLLEYWRILRRRKGILLINAVLCALVAFAFTRLQTPAYRASTSLEFQGLKEKFLNMVDLDPIGQTGNSSNDIDIQTQIEVLRSRSLLGRVVSRLKMAERPEFAGERAWLPALRKQADPAASAPASRHEQAIAQAEKDLKVTPVRGSRIIRIEYSSTDPQLAADFANALTNEFMEQHLELRLKSARRTGEWLARQLEDLKAKFQKSEDQLQAYARAAGLMFTEEKESVAAQKLKQLQEELLRAQADRYAKQSRYEMAKLGTPDALPEVLDNSSLREYQVRLTALRQQLADLRALLTPSHYKVKQTQAQIAELETAVARERANVVRRIANEYESAQRRERLVLSAYREQAGLVSEQDTRVAHYNMLKQEVEANRQLYEAMLQKVKEASLASALRASNIAVIDPAEVPSRPYKPRLFMNLCLGLVSGIFLGTVFVFTRERADRSLKGPGDTALFLNVPELGVIPSRSAENGSGVLPGFSGSRGPSRGARDGSGPVELATWHRAPSLVSEAFRATLVSILLSAENADRPLVIVITSPGAGEGKTTAITNLGIALARIGRRVLLIDADMRKPRLHEVFALPNQCGLTDFLRASGSGEESLPGQLVRGTQVPGLFVLTSGSSPSMSSYLLHSGRVQELLHRCRAEFDTILIDTPPVLQLADARLLGRLAEAVILVCRAGETHRDNALAAVRQLAADGVPLMGTILNDWNPSEAGPGYRQCYQ